MELGEFRNAVGELSQLLTQAIVVPFRRKHPSRVHTAPARPEGAPAGGSPLGWLVVAGGGRLPDDLVVEMIHRAGGRRAKATVAPAAHLDPAWAGERYVRYLTRFGMQDVSVVDLSTRERASDPSTVTPLSQSDLILLGGGDGQLLLDCVAGTDTAQAVRSAHHRGAVVAAVGGAAAAAGDLSIAWRGPGEDAGGAPRAADVEVRPGLGLLPSCLVDRQGLQRGQVGRLFFAVAGLTSGEARLAAGQGGGGTGAPVEEVRRRAGPAPEPRGAEGLLGIGLDEETALLVEPGWQAEVWGPGAVMLVDGRTASPARAPWGGSDCALTGVTVHVLPQGWRLDLRARHAYPPDAVRSRSGI